jgi:hypothetical protein
MGVSGNIQAQEIQTKKQRFLEAYAAAGTITEAAEIAAIGRRCHYRWMDADPEYAKAFVSATEQAADRLEQEARRRAIEGTTEPVWYRGQKVGAVQKYSDTLLIFLLKGCRPEKYADRRWYVEQSGPGGGPIQVDASVSRVAALTPEERREALEELRKMDTDADKDT